MNPIDLIVATLAHHEPLTPAQVEYLQHTDPLGYEQWIQHGTSAAMKIIPTEITWDEWVSGSVGVVAALIAIVFTSKLLYQKALKPGGIAFWQNIMIRSQVA